MLANVFNMSKGIGTELFFITFLESTVGSMCIHEHELSVCVCVGLGEWRPRRRHI